MTFPLNVYLTAFVGAFAVSYFSLPMWRGLCRQMGLVDDPGHRKIHDQPIPLAGGFTVLTGMVAPLMIGVILVLLRQSNPDAVTRLLSHGLSRRAVELGAIVIGAVGIVMLGWLDDKHELRPGVKFGGQLLIAILVAAAGVRITLFVKDPIFSYAVTVLWILTVINAFNFMDNMNGLCAGLGAIGAWFFGQIAAIEGQYLVTVMALLMCGALLGFLPHNFPKATAFLGDSGSHLVGYLLAVMAILPHFYSKLNPRPSAVCIPLLVLAVPLLDLAWVVVLRWRLGKPFYVGDNNHLSHRLVRGGFGGRDAVILIWFIATLLGGVSVLLVLL